MMSFIKKCGKCKIEKCSEEFSKNRDKKDGLQTTCKLCTSKIGSEWYTKNKERKKETSAKWYIKNKERAKEKATKWKKENKEKVKKTEAKWKAGNKEKIAKQFIQRYHNDLNFRLLNILRTRVRGAIKNGHKSAKTMSLLGCSIEEVKSHLESQFKEGMTWDNHGEWHIDHIIPCASFDLTDPEQQKKCFHYTNLQPLWATENMSKGAKLEYQIERD